MLSAIDRNHCPPSSGMPVRHHRNTQLTCFRQDKPHRGRRSKVDEKRGKICNMASIHSRPGEIEGRLVPGHWEGDLIKGAANRSSVGTLVERTSGKVVLIKLTDAKASTTRDGFVEGMLRIPAPLRLTMTYDQGKEMARHRELAVATGIRVYFADPHSCVYRKFDSGWTRRTDGISSRPDEGSAQADSRHPAFALQVESLSLIHI